MNKNKNTQLQFPFKNGTTILRLFRFYERESFFNWNKMHIVFSFFHHFYWVFFRIFGLLFLNLKIHGQKNLDSLKDEGVLFVANHQGGLDGLLIGASIPLSYYRRIKCMRYMMYYKYITKNPISFLFWIAGAFPIFSARGDLAKALSKTVAMLKEKHNVMMFPTGGRKKYFDTKDARPGVGYLAKTLNMQIVPVFIKNTHKVKFKDIIFRTRKVIVTFGKPFRYGEVASREMEYKDIAIKIMEKVGSLIKFPPTEEKLTYADIKNRKLALETEEAKHLLESFPEDIKRKFTRCYLNGEVTGSEPSEILGYFLANSRMTRLIKSFPGSAEAFEYLYKAETPKSHIDKYFLKCKSGQQIYRRILSLESNLPRLINKLYKGRPLLIDNIFSGPGRDMINVLQKNRDLINKVQVRNIDIDKKAIDIGKRVVKELGLTKSFSFVNKPYHKARKRSADLIILVGVLCPLQLHISERILDHIKSYSRPGGYIVYSTAQNSLVEDDPLIDFIMRLAGWSMSYKSDKEAWDLAKESGWEPIEQFFDEPLHHNCMTIARLNK